MEIGRVNKNKIRLSIFRLKFHQKLLFIAIIIFAINVGAATGKSIPKRGCGNSNKPFASRNQKPKRSVHEDSINEPLFVETIIVVDNGVYRQMNGNLYEVHKYCAELVAGVNSLFKPLNVSVNLVDVVVWMDEDEIWLDWSSAVTVENFKKYRSDVLAVDRPYVNAQLVTSKPFTDAIGRVAEVGGMCSEDSVAINNYNDDTTETMAHELGHLLGMMHDNSYFSADDEIGAKGDSTDWLFETPELLYDDYGFDVVIQNEDLSVFFKPLSITTEADENAHEDDDDDDNGRPTCKCPDAACIMHSTASNVRSWGNCNVYDFEEFKRDSDIGCLRQKPSALFEPTKCGNKIVDSGEECDCGSPRECRNMNPACDPKTCKLREDVECKSGSCCNLTRYKYHPAGLDCRPASNECELPSHCDGQYSVCPKNKPQPTNTTCNNGKGVCFDGICQPIVTTTPIIEPKSCPFNCSGHGICDNGEHCVCDEGFALPDCTASVPEENSYNDFWLDLNICLFAVSLISIFFLCCWYRRTRSKAPNDWEKPLVPVDHSNPCGNELLSWGDLGVSKRVDQPKSSIVVVNDNSTGGDFKTFFLFGDI